MKWLVLISLCTAVFVVVMVGFSLNLYKDIQSQKPLELTFEFARQESGEVCDQINLVRTYRTPENWIGVYGQPKLFVDDGTGVAVLSLGRGREYAINSFCQQGEWSILASTVMLSVSEEGEIKVQEQKVYHFMDRASY